MATRVIDDSKLQNIAVAIQNKDGGGQMTVDQMPTRIEQNLQSKAVLDSVIDGSITSIESDVTNIRAQSFSNCTNLESCNLRNVTALSSNAFSGCSSLVSINAPNAISINEKAFASCSNLRTIDFENVMVINQYAFYRSGLRNLYAPSTITLASYSFYQAYYVTRLFFPNVEEIGSASFAYCNALRTIVLHKHANLQNSNILNNGCPAIIYVKPEDLSWYSTATNWSTLYVQNRIKSIEDLTGDDLVWYQEQLARYQAQTA